MANESSTIDKSLSFDQLSAAPPSPKLWEIYNDTNDGLLTWNGTAWVQLGGGAQQAIVSDWIAYTPTFVGLGTPASVDVWYKRIGDTLYVEGFCEAGTVDASTFSVSLPAGLSIDYTKLPILPVQQVGWITSINSSSSYPTTSTGPFFLFTDGTTSNQIFVANSGTSPTAFFPNAGNGPFVSGNGITFSFTVPISGWTATGGGGFPNDGVAITAKVYLSTNASGGTNTTIPFDRVTYDTNAAFNTSTYGYIVPVPGYYSVSACINLAGGDAGLFEVYKNGAQISDGATATYIAQVITASNIGLGTVQVECVEGDILTVVNDTNGTVIETSGSWATFTRVTSITSSGVSQSADLNYQIATVSAVGQIGGSGTWITAGLTLTTPSISGSLWKLDASLFFYYAGPNPGYEQTGGVWSNTDGTNTTAPPTPLTPTAGLPGPYYNETSLTTGVWGNNTFAVPSIIVGPNTTVYLIPYAAFINTNQVQIDGQILAIRIK